jgi:hypothetical protein
VLSAFPDFWSLAGGCWVSRLCYEPKVGANVIHQFLNSLKKLRIYQGYIPVRVQSTGNLVTAVAFGKDTPILDAPVEVLVASAKVTIDATDLGDLINLSGTEFRIGSDFRAQTGELHAPEVGNSECVQPITMGFVLELDDPKKSNKIPKPPRYDPELYKFGNSPAFGERSFWQYRRIFSSALMGTGKDLALINWHYGNDFKKDCGEFGCNLIGKTRTQQQAILERARDQGLGFVYWLQNDAPRDGGKGKGYPNLKLREDVMGGGAFSQQPYIRESRRIVGLTTLTEGDVGSTKMSVPKRYLFRSITAVRIRKQLSYCGDYSPNPPLGFPSMRIVLESPDISSRTFMICLSRVRRPKESCRREALKFLFVL